MRSSPKKRTLTVRLPDHIHLALVKLAERRNMSLNSLLAEGAGALVAAEAEHRLFNDFTQVGQDADDLDVDFAVEVQREVLHGEG